MKGLQSRQAAIDALTRIEPVATSEVYLTASIDLGPVSLEAIYKIPKNEHASNYANHIEGYRIY